MHVYWTGLSPRGSPLFGLCDVIISKQTVNLRFGFQIVDRECKKKRALSRFFQCSFFSSLCIFFSCVPLSESLKLANFDQIQVAFKHWCYLNGEWGRKNEHGEGGNEKWEQSRELEMKLLIGLRFKAGFLPICHFPIPRARPLLHVPVACVQTSPISFVCVCNKGNRRRLHAGNVPRFNNILLNTIFQLDRILCFVKKWKFAFSDRRNSRLALLQ